MPGRGVSRRHGSGPTGPPAPRENGGSGPTALAGLGRSPPTGWNTPRPVAPTARSPLIGGRVRGSRQVITLPRVRARVTEHVALERACPKCRKRWAHEPDWGALSVGRQRFGVSVQSEVSMLREECRFPFRVIQRYPRSSRGQALKWRFGLRLSVGDTGGFGPWGGGAWPRRIHPVTPTDSGQPGGVRGPKRAGVKMAVMATSGASALPRCATSSTGRAGARGW